MPQLTLFSAVDIGECLRHFYYAVVYIGDKMMADRLGQFEELILLALVRLRERAYGMSVRREILARTGREVAIGAVYTTLERLERKGYVSSRMGEPTRERGGRAKRYFKIEAPGVEALNQNRVTVENMIQGLANA